MTITHYLNKHLSEHQKSTLNKVLLCLNVCESVVCLLWQVVHKHVHLNNNLPTQEFVGLTETNPCLWSCDVAVPLIACAVALAAHPAILS